MINCINFSFKEARMEVKNWSLDLKNALVNNPPSSLYWYWQSPPSQMEGRIAPSCSHEPHTRQNLKKANDVLKIEERKWSDLRTESSFPVAPSCARIASRRRNRSGKGRSFKDQKTEYHVGRQILRERESVRDHRLHDLKNENEVIFWYFPIDELHISAGL